jgi:hypothetical protein
MPKDRDEKIRPFQPADAGRRMDLTRANGRTRLPLEAGISFPEDVGNPNSVPTATNRQGSRLPRMQLFACPGNWRARQTDTGLGAWNVGTGLALDREGFPPDHKYRGGLAR